MKEQTKAQLRAEIERMSAEIKHLRGVVRYYRDEPYTIDFKVYLLLSDLIENNKSEIMEDLNYGHLSNHGAYILNAQYDLLTSAAGCLADLPKRADNGDLLRVDNGTPEGGYA
jgi:hypothetical protein